MSETLEQEQLEPEKASLTPEKMDLASLDIAEEKRAELLRLFPEVRTEGGKVDFDRLRMALGEAVDVGKERYGMNWPGKADCFKAIQRPSLGTLLPARGESVNFDETENLIIEGDNLEVLKLLQKSYQGKVKMIYIDPPYNTGNDFIYPDNYSESLQTYLEYTGQVDSEGRRFSNNTETDGRFHSKWLNMMYPRLYLARNLLRDDGVIFISIGDKELQNLSRICDEIFGEDAFLASFIWEKRTNRENRKAISSRHDYALTYCRDSSKKDTVISSIPMTEAALSRYKNPDGDPRGAWKSDPAHAQAGHATKSQFYTLRAPNGKEHDLQSGRCWLYTREVMEEAIRDKRIWFGQDGNGVPRIKTYLDHKDRKLTPETIWFANEAGTNESAKNSLKELFGGQAVFDTPKPVEMIELMIKLAGQEGIVLDFFAGAGATGHAVMAQNCSDGGNRKFILIQLPERVNPEWEEERAAAAFLERLHRPKVISELTKERIIRAGAELKSANPMFAGDLGFRALTLATSNFTVWSASTQSADVSALGQQLELHVDHILPGRSSEDLLYEILLKSGFPLTTPVETFGIEGKAVHSVGNGAMLICLDKQLTHEAIKAIAERKPERVVCLDEGFAGNDQLKTNAVLIMKSKGVTRFQTI